MARPRAEGGTGGAGKTPPPPRVTEGAPARPGSLLPQAQGRDKTTPAAGTELPANNVNRIPPNANVTPVRMELGPGGGQYPAYQWMSFYEASQYANQLRGASRRLGTGEYDNFVNQLRSYTDQRLGTDAAVDEAWKSLLQDAQSGDVAALELLNTTAPGGAGDGGTDGRIVGSYTGPRETVTLSNERDLRSAVDAMAAQVLGRAATDSEFQKALSQVRSAERTDPTITTTGVGGTVTQSGLTAEGRSSIIRESLMKGPEAEEFGKATKMMDLFYSALEARPSGA